MMGKYPTPTHHLNHVYLPNDDDVQKKKKSARVESKQDHAAGLNALILIFSTINVHTQLFDAAVTDRDCRCK